MDQLLLGMLAFGDIGKRAGHTRRWIAIFGGRHTAGQNPAVAAVLAPDAVFALEIGDDPVDVVGDRMLDVVQVLGMDALKPFLG